MSESTLSWRIPTSGDPRLLRLGLAQVGLASIVAALVLIVAVPREWLVPALLGLIPLAVLMAFRRWKAYRQSMEGQDNVRIDSAGIHWLDAAGEERTFRREDVVGFQIGRDDDTLRPVPALKLRLAGGFVSQPVELHPPATSEAVRGLLVGEWNVAELEVESPSDSGNYDAAFLVYSECHEEFHEWHWEGTGQELRRFFELFAAADDELPLPPAGAKPAERIVLLNRRQAMRLRLGISAAAQFEPDVIFAPASVLRAISARAATSLATTEAMDDRKFDVSIDPKNTWTFHLHVLPA
jgi:hypothetical protein